jgi:hypothetical protein
MKCARFECDKDAVWFLRVSHDIGAVFGTNTKPFTRSVVHHAFCDKHLVNSKDYKSGVTVETVSEDEYMVSEVMGS